MKFSRLIFEIFSSSFSLINFLKANSTSFFAFLLVKVRVFTLNFVPSFVEMSATLSILKTPCLTILEI